MFVPRAASSMLWVEPEGLDFGTYDRVPTQCIEPRPYPRARCEARWNRIGDSLHELGRAQADRQAELPERETPRHRLLPLAASGVVVKALERCRQEQIEQVIAREPALRGQPCDARGVRQKTAEPERIAGRKFALL